MLFTNKDGFSETAITKAEDNVRLLRSSEFSSSLNTFFELMEKGWKATTPYEKLAVMEKIITPEVFETIFEPGKDPQITIEELNQLMEK